MINFNLVDPLTSKTPQTFKMVVRRATLAAIVTPFLLAPSMPAQDLPDGPGKELLMNVCTACHTINRIVEKKNPPSGFWQRSM